MNPSEDVKIEEQEQSPQETPVAEVSEPVVEAAPEEPAETEAVAEESPVAEEQVAAQAETEPADAPVMNAEELLGADATDQPSEEASAEANLKAVVEAVIYITEEPLTVEQVANALDQPKERIEAVLQQLTDEYAKADRGITIREVAGGFKMGTKPEHHEAIRNFVKRMKPPLKLSIAALETLAVIAYKQPITAPEIMEIRGVQGAGVIKTLLDRKLIAIGGRKQVVGKPILYKTTKEFLMQFGLKDLAELPTLKEFEELRRLAFADTEEVEAAPVEAPKPVEAQPEPAAEDAPAESPASQESGQVEQASQESDTMEASESPASAADSETTAAASSE